MKIVILKNYEEISRWTARYITKQVNDFKPLSENPFVLGLPTGSTPIGTYKELIAFNKRSKISFENVVTFNMDEYMGIDKNHRGKLLQFHASKFI